MIGGAGGTVSTSTVNGINLTGGGTLSGLLTILGAMGSQAPLPVNSVSGDYSGSGSIVLSPRSNMSQIDLAGHNSFTGGVIVPVISFSNSAK